MPALPPRGPGPARLQNGRLEDFVKTIFNPSANAVDKVIACRVHKDDENLDDEPYYLARVVAAPWQLQEQCLVAGNIYNEGWFVTRIKWYSFVKERKNGDGEYRLLSSPPKGEVYSCTSFVRQIIVSFKSASRGRYVLSSADNDRLEKYGSLD